MIEVNAVFTKESVKEMGKSKRISNYVIFPLLGVVVFVAGILTFIQGAKGFDLFFAILMTVLGPFFVFIGFWITRNEQKENIESFGVSNGEVVMNYKFGDKGVAVSRTASGKTVKETIYYNELYKVKKTKKAFMIYVTKDELFYVPIDAFVTGTPEELFNVLYKNKVILDY